MRDEPVELTSDQRRDDLITAAWAGGAHARLFSLRAREARAQAMPGQDYARLVAQRLGTAVAFCVCDGMGQSYQGDFAARFLGDRLVNWLADLVAIPSQRQEAVDALAERLQAWAPEAHAELLEQPVRADALPLVREVLDDLRATQGSAAVFVAGRVDRAASVAGDTAGDTARTRLLLCWLGNVAAQVFADGARVPLDAFDDERSWWSTVRGCKGALHVEIIELVRLERLLIFTDGLLSLRDEVHTLDDTQLQAAAERLLATPTNDDMTLLDLRWTPPNEPVTTRSSSER